MKRKAGYYWVISNWGASFKGDKEPQIMYLGSEGSTLYYACGNEMYYEEDELAYISKDPIVLPEEIKAEIKKLNNQQQ